MKVTLPHTAGQPFWGARVAALGVGTPALPIHRLNTATLEQALYAIETESIHQRAAQLGEVIRREDDTGNAIAILEYQVANASTT